MDGSISTDISHARIPYMTTLDGPKEPDTSLEQINGSSIWNCILITDGCSAIYSSNCSRHLRCDVITGVIDETVFIRPELPTSLKVYLQSAAQLKHGYMKYSYVRGKRQGIPVRAAHSGTSFPECTPIPAYDFMTNTE